MIFGKKGSNEDVEALTSKIDVLERQNEIMRSALEFYSEPENWTEGHKYRDADDATIFTDGTESAATVDKGSRAYRALEAIKKL